MCEMSEVPGGRSPAWAARGWIVDNPRAIGVAAIAVGHPRVSVYLSDGLRIRVVVSLPPVRTPLVSRVVARLVLDKSRTADADLHPTLIVGVGVIVTAGRRIKIRVRICLVEDNNGRGYREDAGPGPGSGRGGILDLESSWCWRMGFVPGRRRGFGAALVLIRAREGRAAGLAAALGLSRARDGGAAALGES